MTAPLFIATERFDPSDGDRWRSYCEWAKIPGLLEVVSLDFILCPRIVTELQEEDWHHIVCESFRSDYFYDLDYLKQRVQNVPRKNILGVFRNPDTHISSPPAPDNIRFVGYDLIEEETQISALTNCGGFPDVFCNDELNCLGLVPSYDRASEIRRVMADGHPDEPHAQCELYAIWRLESVGTEKR
ncbi:MAG: hypothetical protein NTW96_08135 [Planctomycetia bacterium]|nr:hypothetical protein [Planctomycetia bacterium]